MRKAYFISLQRSQVFFRCTSYPLLEKAQEMLRILEAQHVCNLFRVHIRGQQGVLCYFRYFDLDEFMRTLACWKSHATLTLLAKQDLPTFGYNMIVPLKSWCWGSILFYPFKISRFS